MAQVIKEIELEVSKPNFIQAIVAKQYDNKSRYLRVKLVDNGEKITVKDTSSVVINARRSDGGENKFSGTVDAGQGTVLVPLTYWMLELEGKVISDVSVYDTDKILTTTNFTIEVERASCQNGSVSVDDADVDVLTSLIINVQNVHANFAVKHTYDPNSTNAISGRGVSKALENVKVDVDAFISGTSTGAVQNKVIKQYVDKSIADLVAGGGISSDGRIQLKPNFANNTSECIDTSKLYVLPDGNIYAYMMSTVYPKITTKENPVGYYYDNNGALTFYTDNANSCSKETNLIPVTEGDVFKVTLRSTKGSAANGGWYDENNNLISIIKFVDSSQQAITTEVTVPAGAKYVRFFSNNWNTDTSDIPWSVEWVYCSTATSEKWTDTGHAFVPADYETEIVDHEKRLEQLESQKVESILKGKKIVYDGDSICALWGGTGGNGGAYPHLISEVINGSDAATIYYDNQAVGGARIVTAEGATNRFGETVTISHSVVDNLVNLPTDGDLYCFECCVNDQFNMVTLGDFNPTEYREDRLNLNTKEYCGALETIIRYALTNFSGKPICFIIPHKCANQGSYGNGVTFADFREKIIGLFEKYAIPYYDAWAESGLNYWNDTHLDKYFIYHPAGATTGDGCHPNTDGYKKYYVPQLINLFEKIMPRG
jgi:lysophospholipase L1-like esterase